MGTKVIFEDSSGDMFFLDAETGTMKVRWFDSEITARDLVLTKDLDAFIDWLVQERNKWIKDKENDQV